MDNPIIIFGSSRSNGNTFQAVKEVTNVIGKLPFINLADYQISDFDYEHQNSNDGFMEVINKILNYQTYIFATPIYWYTMSSVMKRFVDRFSDLLSIDKNTGRLLRNKDMAVITSYSIYPEGKDGFEKIFVNTAKYLGMNYLGCYFHYAGEDLKTTNQNPQLLTQFTNMWLRTNVS